MFYVFNAIVILATLSMAYLWATRGLFSAFLHLLCTLVAGAVAFALWEPLANVLLGVLPTTGFLRFLHGLSWSIALIAPFTISLIVMRVVVDKIAPNNTKQAGVVDLVGGGACGLVSSVIAVGFVVLGLSYARLSFGMIGYKPLWYGENKQESGGSLIRSQSLWLPVDKITAGLYSRFSTTTLATGEPLDKWYPDLVEAGFAARISPGNGQGRNTYTDSDFSLVRTYTVGNTQAGSPIGELLTYEQDDKKLVQPYRDIDKQPVGQGYLAGYVVELKASAKEDSKGAQVIMSNGQATLLVENVDGETKAVYPVAMISQARPQDGDLFGRWKFEGEGDFIASVGGASTAKMGLEFVVPAGFEPIALRIKGARLELDSAPAAKQPQTYSGYAARDRAIQNGALISGGADVELDESEVVVFDGSQITWNMPRTGGPPGVGITTALGYSLTAQNARRGMNLEKGARDVNFVVSTDGVACFSPEELTQGRTAERTFRVEQFAVGADQVMVQVSADSEDLPASFINAVMRTIDSDQPLRLIDTDGNIYEAVGFVYEDREGACIRLTPPDPLDGTGDLDKTMSSARTDQKLRLLFLVSKGVEVQYYAVGEKAIMKFDPPFEATTR